MATFNNVDTFEELRDAITASKTNGQADTINITGNITLSADLPTILADSTGLTINGGNFTLNGNNARRILFIKSGTVNLNGLNFSNGRAQGGSRSAGMGGALFIYGGNVTVSNATFANNQALGGSSVASTDFYGIGLRYLANAANNGTNGTDGTVTAPNGTNGTPGGYGGFGGSGGFGFDGGSYTASGNGGNGGNSGFGMDGTGGGFGGDGSSNFTLGGGGRGGTGGAGGFGGAGGKGGQGGNGGDTVFPRPFPNAAPTPGGNGGNGGVGGFGGGGGVGGKGGNVGRDNGFPSEPKGNGGNGGNGGYGAGGGKGGTPIPDLDAFGVADRLEGFVGVGGLGGFGGGNASPGGYQFDQAGQNVPNPISGGGAGMGGAIFIRSGSLSLNTVAFNSNSTTGGTGYQNGKGYGGAIFAMKSTTNTNGNNQGMPTTLSTVSLSRVTFSGNNAGDANGTITPGTIGSNIDYNNDDLYGKTFTEVNGAPNVGLINALTSLPENSSTASRIKVADIVVTDDGVGTNTLSLAGADAAAFEIISNVLYLKAGTTLDFETKPSYSVAVNVNDPTVGSNPDASALFTLPIGNVNEAPTAVNFDNAVTEIAENSNTTSPIKVADIIVTDDALGTNNLTLSGNAADTAAFEIVGGSLYIRTGTVLDFETKPVYTVTVNVDDPTVGSSPDASRTFTLNLADVTDAPPFLVTNTNDSGVGSLRWAIDNANRAPNTQTIDFAPEMIGQTIDLSSGALQITDSTRINADIDENGSADVTVDAGGISRVLEVSANKIVTIQGMVLKGGLGDGAGGIFNRGNLTLRNSSVRNNIGIGNTGLGGGGIYNSGASSVLTLLGSTISNNSTTERGGGIYNNGGQVTIDNSRVENNSAEAGGGFYNNGGSVTVNDSTFDNNNSNTIGGGLVNDNGTTTLNSSTLINNTAANTLSSAIFNNGSTLGLGSVVTLNGGTVSGGVYGNTINSGLLVIKGTGNGETLQGSSGGDQISGLEGDDLLQGFQGNDTLVGGDGNDVVNGGDNNDLLQGGAGNDLLGGLGGTDQMEGGTGNDTYTVNNAAATLIEAVGEGTDTVRSQISWSLGSNFENLTLLGTGNLDGTGNDLNNTLTGNSGNNTLNGQSGNDQMVGNDGDDVLIGGIRVDTSTGGAGNDRFAFNIIAGGVDRITDFVSGSDKIQISAGGFGAGLSIGILAESQFALNSITTTAQRFLYNTTTGALFFDANGRATGERTQIATLTTKPSISANDIVVVA